LNLVFYSTKSENEGQQLLGALKAPLKGKKIRTFRTLVGLGSYLKNFPRPETVVLLTANESELSHLVALKKHFGAAPVILILPDRSETSVKLACSMGALMTCFQDGDFSDVAAMMARLRSLQNVPGSPIDPRRFAWAGDIPYLPGSSPFDAIDSGPAGAGFFA
jgi:hypothetical protein